MDSKPKPVHEEFEVHTDWVHGVADDTLIAHIPGLFLSSKFYDFFSFFCFCFDIYLISLEVPYIEEKQKKND